MPFQLGLAYISTLTFSCVQMILFTTIPYIAEKTGVQTANIIAAISIGSFIFSFTGPFWATKSDRWGRKLVLNIGIGGMFLSFLCFAILFWFNDQLPLSSKIALVFLARIIYGLLASAIVPTSQAWQLELVPESDKLKVLTKNSMCLNLGRILGPILVLLKQVQFEKVIYAASLWSFGLVCLYFFVKETHERKINTHAFVFKDVIDRWKASISESLNPILIALVFTAFTGILHSFLGHHLKSVLNISGQEATLMFAKIILILSLVTVVLQQLSIMVFKSKWRPRIIIGSLALVVGTIAMMEATSIGGIWAAIAFIAVAVAFIPPAYLALTSQSRENSENENVFGKKLGLAGVAHSMGYALGAGLIALSMKLHLFSPRLVVIFISMSMLWLCASTILKERYKHD